MRLGYLEEISRNIAIHGKEVRTGNVISGFGEFYQCDKTDYVEY